MGRCLSLMVAVLALFATNPAYRWQNLGEFNMLANAILNFNDFPK